MRITRNGLFIGEYSLSELGLAICAGRVLLTDQYAKEGMNWPRFVGEISNDAIAASRAPSDSSLIHLRDIKVSRNGAPIATVWTLVEVGRALRERRILTSDFYVRGGMTEWRPVSEILSEATYAAYPSERKGHCPGCGKEYRPPSPFISVHGSINFCIKTPAEIEMQAKHDEFISRTTVYRGVYNSSESVGTSGVRREFEIRTDLCDDCFLYKSQSHESIRYRNSRLR